MPLDLQLAIPESVGDDFLVVGCHPFRGVMAREETHIAHCQVCALLDVNESLKGVRGEQVMGLTIVPERERKKDRKKERERGRSMRTQRTECLRD